MIDFTLVSEIENVEIIAVNRSIRDLERLNREFGRGRWRKLKGTAYVKLENGRVRLAEIHWYEAHGIGKRDMKLKDTFMNSQNLSSQFVVCVNTSENEASLEFGKIYQVIPDAEAESDGMIRIIDESGEDYMFSASRFYPLQLPAPLEQMLSVAR